MSVLIFLKLYFRILFFNSITVVSASYPCVNLMSFDRRNKIALHKRIWLLSVSIILSSFLITNFSEAEIKKKRLKISNLRSFKGSQVEIRGGGFSDSLDEILTSSVDTNLYDPLTLVQLNNLKVRGLPWWEREDSIDEVEMRRVTQKAIGIQGSLNFISLLRRSDLRESYKSIEKDFKSFTNRFRYALQDTGDGYTLSQNKKGEELVEFSLKMSLSKGADPQVLFGDSLRLRYDWAEQQTMLEFGVNF